jgi:hypothetical protein
MKDLIVEGEKEREREKEKKKDEGKPIESTNTILKEGDHPMTNDKNRRVYMYMCCTHRMIPIRGISN